MPVAGRKSTRSARRSTTRSTTPARRPRASAASTALVKDHIIRSLQEQLFAMVCSSEAEGRTPIGVSAAFVQTFRRLTKVEGVAVYVRDEQTREMTCLAEFGCGEASLAATWRQVLARAEKNARVVRGALQGFRLHRIGRMEGLVMVQAGAQSGMTGAKLTSVLDAVEPWLAVALDHARLSCKYAAKILRIQHMEQVSDVLNSSLAQEEKLRRALDAAIRLVEAEAGALFLVTGDQSLAVQAVSGERAGLLAGLQSVIAAAVHQTGRPVLITQRGQDPRLAPEQGWQRVMPVASLVSVPVRAGMRAVGVLEVINRRSGKPFSNWDLLELASLSNQFGLAIENMRR